MDERSRASAMIDPQAFAGFARAESTLRFEDIGILCF
jgi:hypothetical protein